MLSDRFNAVFTVTRQTRTGTEDGTPIYGTATHQVSGWFDEIEARPLDEPFRDQSVPYVDRRAMFLCAAGSDIQQDDEGTVALNDGTARGSWEVMVIRAAPTPSGAGHLEVQLQGAKEGK